MQMITVLESSRKRIGGKWKPLIMFILYKRPHRFNKIKQLATGISGRMLTQCLKELESDGMIEKKENSHVRYYLTPVGCRIVELFIEISSYLP
jgi:DNA-binding HxlR family transcriptional regulator